LGPGVIPVAFAAALPLVQWCALCAPAATRECPAGAAAAPTSTSPVCASGHDGCPEHGNEEGQCPFERPSGRTFCVGAAMGGPGVRPHAPELSAPVLEIAFLAAEPPSLFVVVRESWPIGRQAEARPPTRSRARRPPVRGPPAA